MMKALFGAMILFVCSILQGRLRPFKIEIISDLEHREMLSSMLVLYGGLIFVQDDTSLQFLDIVIFIMIMIMNARFLILWVYCVSAVYKRYRIMDFFSGWMKRAFCIKVTDEDEDKM